jgi:hypothetical protein
MAMPPMPPRPAMPPMAMPPMSMPPMSMTMDMYFTTKVESVYLLFEGWYPTTPGAFALSCVAVAALGATEEILRKVNAGVNARLVAGGGTVLYRNSVRALLTFAHSTMSYGCMLIAMSFNAFVFFSLMLGFAIGTLLTGHWTEKASQPPVPREIISMGTLPDIRVSGLDGDTPREQREVVTQVLLDEVTTSQCCR